jgi:predicted nucleic-acid-binding Zn-ribbon protein
MHLPWSAQQYERTCADCGYSWRVPREFARKRVLSVYGATSGIRGRGSGPAAKADLQAGYAVAERAASFRTCPKCSSEQYSQRPVRS